jgi:hypothetical protein
MATPHCRHCPTGPVTTFAAMMGTKGEVHYIHGEDPFAGGGTANLTTRAAARVSTVNHGQHQKKSGAAIAGASQGSPAARTQHAARPC